MGGHAPQQLFLGDEDGDARVRGLLRHGAALHHVLHHHETRQLASQTPMQSEARFCVRKHLALLAQREGRGNGKGSSDTGFGTIMREVQPTDVSNSWLSFSILHFQKGSAKSGSIPCLSQTAVFLFRKIYSWDCLKGKPTGKHYDFGSPYPALDEPKKSGNRALSFFTSTSTPSFNQ